MALELLAQTLRERRRSLAWWSLGLGAMVALNVAFYPSVQGSQGLSDYSKDLPEAMRALFAGGELDLASATGYLNSQIFALMAPLILLIFAIGFGASAVAGREERGTLDLLLAQPVRRESVVCQQFLALATLVLALSAVLLCTVAIGSAVVDLEVGLDNLIAATLSVGMLTLLFASIALAMGAIWAGRARAAAVAAGLALAAWMLDGFAQAVPALEPWRFLSPYYQALGGGPLQHGADFGGLAILVALTGLVVTAGFFGLRRRDVRQ